MKSSNPITTYLLKRTVGAFIESRHPDNKDLGMADNSLTQVQDRCLIEQTYSYDGQKFRLYHLRLSSNAQSPQKFNIEFIYNPDEQDTAKMRMRDTNLYALFEINQVLTRFMKTQFPIKSVYVLPEDK